MSTKSKVDVNFQLSVSDQQQNTTSLIMILSATEVLTAVISGTITQIALLFGRYVQPSEFSKTK